MSLSPIDDNPNSHGHRLCDMMLESPTNIKSNANTNNYNVYGSDISLEKEQNNTSSQKKHTTKENNDILDSAKYYKSMEQYAKVIEERKSKRKIHTFCWITVFFTIILSSSSYQNGIGILFIIILISAILAALYMLINSLVFHEMNKSITEAERLESMYRTYKLIKAHEEDSKDIVYLIANMQKTLEEYDELITSQNELIDSLTKNDFERDFELLKELLKTTKEYKDISDVEIELLLTQLQLNNLRNEYKDKD